MCPMRASDRPFTFSGRPVRRTEIATLATAAIVLLMALLPTAPPGDREALLPYAGAMAAYSVLWFRILPSDLFGRWHFLIGTSIPLAIAFTMLVQTGRSNSLYFDLYLLAILATAFGLQARTTIAIGAAALATYAVLVLRDIAEGRAESGQQAAVRLITLAIVVVFVWLIVRALQTARSGLAARTAELAAKRAEIETVLETAQCAVITMDQGGRITRWNDQAAKIFGHDRRSALGREMAELVIPPRLRQAHHGGISRFMTSGEGPIIGRRVELEALHADGSEFPVELTVAAYRDGEQWAFTALINDITARRASEAELSRLAFEDSLTGLPNRALLLDRLRQVLAKAERDKGPASVLLMDLDLFKDVNDRWGHQFGDRVLAAFAARLREVVRESDTAGRLGGDEFLVILPATDEAGACAVGAKLLRASEAPLRIDGGAVVVRPSVGVGTYPDHAGDVSTLIRTADSAMYLAKRARAGLATPERQASDFPPLA